MSKQVLDVQQMQHLQELGFDTINASMLYCDLYDEEHILVERKHRFDKEENAIVLDGVRDSVIYCKKVTPAYTLQDVLDALPASIGYGRKLYVLKLDMLNKIICYRDTASDDTLVFVKFMEIPLIDAAYSMLCWAIDNKFVETNKNE